VPSARSACGHRVVRVQCAWHGVVLTDILVAYRRCGVDLHLLQLTGYKPLHQDLGEGDQRGGLTGEAVGLTAADGVEGGT
jgi:hypothetical protein